MRDEEYIYVEIKKLKLRAHTGTLYLMYIQQKFLYALRNMYDL